VLLGEFGAAVSTFEIRARAAEDVAAIKFTGGRSGEPKGVIQTHGNMLAVIENLQAFYEFRSTDCNLAIAPLTHGSSHYVFPLLAAGGRHRFVADRSSQSILGALRDDTSVVFMPPTLIYKLLREPGLAPQQFPALRHLTYSAAPMPAARIVAAQRAFGPRLSALYGLTEAPVSICALGPEEMQDPALRQTVGRPCANSRVRIVDDAGKDLPPGAIGHVEAMGPIVMRGYLDEPELTAGAFHDGWLRTGDLGSLDADGYLTLAGRASEVIISGGFNVYPAEIENVLARVDGIRECCVFAVEDEYWGERVEAAIVVEPGTEVAEADVIAFVKAELGPVRAPKAVHVVQSLPRNAVGKVVRRNMPGLVAMSGNSQGAG
jgi:acyl-CoA synthetase (AMP-forming)/AMP-acid ligase II